MSHDPTLTRTMMLRDGRRATAIEVQWGLLERARKYERPHGLSAVGEAVGADVLDRWERVLAGLEHDPTRVAHWVDWVAKQRLVDGYAERHGLEPASAKLKAIDLQYHDLRRRALPGPAGRARDDRHAGRGATPAMTDPPTTTRAYFRGRCLAEVRRTTSSPPTGTRSCSTSAAIRCAGCR